MILVKLFPSSCNRSESKFDGAFYMRYKSKFQTDKAYKAFDHVHHQKKIFWNNCLEDTSNQSWVSYKGNKMIYTFVFLDGNEENTPRLSQLPCSRFYCHRVHKMRGISLVMAELTVPSKKFTSKVD